MTFLFCRLPFVLGLTEIIGKIIKSIRLIQLKM